MFDIIRAAGWPIWPLIAASVIAVALIIERLASLRRSKVVPEALLESILTDLKGKQPDPDMIRRVAAHSPLGRVFAAGLRNVRSTREVMKEAIEEEGRAVAHFLERYLNTLGTIAAAAPLMGLFGTVVGMIQMFLGILDSGIGDVNQLAGGIGKALICTATGMIVAIPALMFHRYFRGRIAGYIVDMEHEAIQLLDTIDTPRAASAPMAAGARGITPPVSGS